MSRPSTIAALGLALNVLSSCTSPNETAEQVGNSALESSTESIKIANAKAIHRAEALRLLCDVKVEGTFEDEFDKESGFFWTFGVNRENEGTEDYNQYGRAGEEIAGIASGMPIESCTDGKIPRVLADYLASGHANSIRYMEKDYGGGFLVMTTFTPENYEGKLEKLPDHIQGMLENDNASGEAMIYFSLSGDPTDYEGTLFWAQPIDNKWIGRGFLESASHIQDQTEERHYLHLLMDNSTYTTSLATLARDIATFDYKNEFNKYGCGC